MKFETLYQELTNSTEMIRALLAGVTQDEAKVKPTPEAWSLLEVACHLYDEEREDFREHLDFILHRQNEEWHTISPRYYSAMPGEQGYTCPAVSHRRARGIPTAVAGGARGCGVAGRYFHLSGRNPFMAATAKRSNLPRRVEAHKEFRELRRKFSRFLMQTF